MRIRPNNRPRSTRCEKVHVFLAPHARLHVAAAAFGMSALMAAEPALALDLDLKGVDGLNTETVASRDRLKKWDNAERYGANTVGNMDRRDVTPDGVRAGNYIIAPSVGTTVVFDDNIFAIDADKQSDIRSEITPGIAFRSQLPRHVLDFSLDGKIVNYVDNPDQDYANYRAKVDGALHFDHAHTLSASVSSVLKHEERDDPLTSLTANVPIPVYEQRAAVGITRDVGRLYGTLATSFERREYEDVTDFSGLVLDQTPRNTDTFGTQLKVGYRISPGFDFIAKSRVMRMDNKGDGTSDRDAWGYEAVAGLAFEANPLLKWRILGGYGIRDYEDTGINDISTSLLQADVQWLPTQRLSVYGALYRQIEEALDIGSGGLVQRGAKLRADYEVHHNLVLSGALEYRQDDFRGLDRMDDVYKAKVSLDYFFTKNWLFTFGYEHQLRDSSDDSLDMHRNRFMAGATLRF